MIAEKSHTAQNLIDKISSSSKVGFMQDETITKALMFLENKGIPNNKHEDYKYCNVDAILKKEFKNIDQKFLTVSDVKPYKLADTITLVVLNGRISSELSDKVILRGLHINSFSNLDGRGQELIASIADVEKDAFIALNTAFSGEGFHLTVERSAELQIPIHILYISSSSSEAVVKSAQHY
jgi:Fe-S cluster assembly protein SufD